MIRKGSGNYPTSSERCNTQIYNSITNDKVAIKQRLRSIIGVMVFGLTEASKVKVGLESGLRSIKGVIVVVEMWED